MDTKIHTHAHRGYTDSWPKQIAAVPPVPAYVVFNRQFQPHTIYLIFDLLFLYAITLNGLGKKDFCSTDPAHL